MIRGGSCNRCGECCAPDPSPSTPLFSLLELADPGRLTGYCPLLRRSASGETECLGYGWHPFYLSGCAAHPPTAQDAALNPSCSYTFSED